MNDDIQSRLADIIEELKAAGGETDVMIASSLIIMLGAIQKGIMPIFAGSLVGTAHAVAYWPMESEPSAAE